MLPFGFCAILLLSEEPIVVPFLGSLRTSAPRARKWEVTGWQWLLSLDYLLRWESTFSPRRSHFCGSWVSRYLGIMSRERGLLWWVPLVHRGQDAPREEDTASVAQWKSELVKAQDPGGTACDQSSRQVQGLQGAPWQDGAVSRMGRTSGRRRWVWGPCQRS